MPVPGKGHHIRCYLNRSRGFSEIKKIRRRSNKNPRVTERRLVGARVLERKADLAQRELPCTRMDLKCPGDCDGYPCLACGGDWHFDLGIRADGCAHPATRCVPMP